MSLRFAALSLVVAVVLGVSVAAAQDRPRQRELTLGALTVPARDLPEGCRLEPFVDRRIAVLQSGRVVLDGQSAGFAANPWHGDDRRMLLVLRGDLYGVLRLPDGPPLSRSETAALEQRSIADVVEGYRASYRSPAGDVTEVYALRFTDAKRAAEVEPPLGSFPSEGALRMLLGPTVVQVRAGSTKPNECFGAVRAHLQTLK